MADDDDAQTDSAVEAALRGDLPSVMARLPSSFAVFGDVQFLPGYSVLLSDEPAVTRLTDMTRAARRSYLESLDLLGEAIERACKDADPNFRRINIEILGNTVPLLHAHIWPRYDWEDPKLVKGPVWLYPESLWEDPASAAGPQHDSLRAAITEQLRQLAR